MTTGTAAMMLPRWTLFVPPFALVALAVSWGRDLGVVLLPLVCIGLIAAVAAAVRRARVRDGQHRPDDPGDRDRVDLARRSAGAGTGRQGDGAARAHRRGQTLTLATGRATLLQGAVHLVVFSAFLFLAVTP